MTVALALNHRATAGSLVKRLRISAFLNKQDLADMASVPPEHVNHFELDLPVPLDSRRRILRVLWAIKAKK
jgi:hypothetical protein